MTTEHDTIAAVITHLHKRAVLDDRAVIARLERIDAEHQTIAASREFWSDTALNEARKGDDLRAKLAACEKALHTLGAVCDRYWNKSVADYNAKVDAAIPPKPSPINADHGSVPIYVVAQLDGALEFTTGMVTESYARQTLRDNGTETVRTGEAVD